MGIFIKSDNMGINKVLVRIGLLLFFLIWLGFTIYRDADQPGLEIHEKSFNPQPSTWFAGDIHVHRSCDGGPAIPAYELGKRMEENNLAVISVLADMGNSEAPDRIEDLQNVTGMDAGHSLQGRIIHYSAEWHWDATSWEYPHQALGGHLVLLGISNAQKMWDESLYKILEWSRNQGSICGFAHMQYLNSKIPYELNCCIPIDYPVEVALGTVDFISEDCNGSDFALEAYYKLLNCGFRPGLAAGTDYPCNGGAPLGTLLTYVNIKDGQITYRKWIEGIKNGNTVISRNGNNEFLGLTVNGNSYPGDEVRLKAKDSVSIEVKWTSIKELTGRIELVSNGEVVASVPTTVKPGESVRLRFTQLFTRSGWLCARRMNENGHQSHTAAIYINIDNQPVRASAADAMFFVKWIENILERIEPGEVWNRYYTNNLNAAQKRYRQARDIYLKILEEAKEKKVNK